MTERYARNQIGVYELWSWYRREVRKFAQPMTPRQWYWGHFPDGTNVGSDIRRAYRSRPDLQVRFPNPYAVREELALALKA